MEPECWITPHLTGGIGNRLFQFAATLGAAEKYNIPCVFNKKLINQNDHGAADNILKLYPKIPVIDSSARHTKLVEPHGDCFRFVPLPPEKPADRIVIEGYRQTPKYFPQNLDLLLPSWGALLSEKQQETLLAKYELTSIIERLQVWSFHIRLGDYKSLPHHQIPIIPYYEICLNQIPKGNTVFLFSDEPHLCSNWFIAECEKRSLKHMVVTEDEIPSLWLFSRCWGGAIVANSTFSWWGAFFAKMSLPADKLYRAYYPSIWGQGLPPAFDVVPSWGTKVQVAL